MAGGGGGRVRKPIYIKLKRRIGPRKLKCWLSDQSASGPREENAARLELVGHVFAVVIRRGV